VPIGLAIDHGKPIELVLNPEGDMTEWSPFTPEEQLAMQIQLLDEMQQFSIMNTIASGMDWHDAMGLVQQFVGQQTLTKGRKADAQRAKQLLAGLHDLQRLDPTQRDAILNSVMKGMSMEEAMHLVRDFVRKASAATNRGAPRKTNLKIPNKKREEKLEAKKRRRLGRMLATLDAVQAHPIHSAVESGDMAVSEALDFVKQFVSSTGKYDSDDNDEAEAEAEAEAEVEKDLDRLRRMLAKLDPVQAAPIHDAVEAGTMDIEEASALVAQFLGVEIGKDAIASPTPRGQMSDQRRQPGRASSDTRAHRDEQPARERGHQPNTEGVISPEALGRLVEALRVLEPAQAESIYNSVRDGTMAISEATHLVEDFVRQSGGDHGGRSAGYSAPQQPDARTKARMPPAEPPVQTGTLSLFASLDAARGLVIAVDTLCAEYPVVKPLALGYLTSNVTGTQKRIAAEGSGTTEIPLRHVMDFEEGREQTILQDAMIIEVWDFGGEPPFFIGHVKVTVQHALYGADGSPYAVWKDPGYSVVLGAREPDLGKLESVVSASQPNDEFESLFADAVRVTLRRDHEYGFGLTLFGPRDDEARTGVFISRVKDRGPAVDSRVIVQGMRILELNGVVVVRASKGEVSRLFQGSSGSVDLLLAQPEAGSHWDDVGTDTTPVTADEIAAPRDARLSDASNQDRPDFNVYSGAPVRAVLYRDRQLGYGFALHGPAEDEPRTGIFIKKVKSGPAAESGVIQEGMRIVAINGDDMTQACKAEAGQYLRGTDRVDIVLEPTEGWVPPPKKIQRPGAISSSSRKGGVRQVGAEQSGNMQSALRDPLPTEDGRVRVVIRRDPQRGYGLSLLGPSEDEPRTGIFISRVKEGPALETGLITEGMRVIRMNGQDVSRSTKADAGAIFRGAGAVDLELEPAPSLDQVLTSPISSVGSPLPGEYNPFAPKARGDGSDGDNPFGRPLMQDLQSEESQTGAIAAETHQVRLRRDPQLGYGLSLVGPKADEPRTGVFISRVKPGPAAQTRIITEGMQILVLNGMNYVKGTKADVGKIFKSADVVDVKLGPRTTAGDAALAASQPLSGSSPVSSSAAPPAAPVAPAAPVTPERVPPQDLGGGRVRVILHKEHGIGFGVSITGPKYDEPRTGIFVSSVKVGSPAEAARLTEGMKLVELNGASAMKACKADIGDVLRKTDRVTMILEQPPSLDDVLKDVVDDFDFSLDATTNAFTADAVPGWSVAALSTESAATTRDAPTARRGSVEFGEGSGGYAPYQESASSAMARPQSSEYEHSSHSPRSGDEHAFGKSPASYDEPTGLSRDLRTRTARGSVEYGESSGGYALGPGPSHDSPGGGGVFDAGSYGGAGAGGAGTSTSTNQPRGQTWDAQPQQQIWGQAPPQVAAFAVASVGSEGGAQPGGDVPPQNVPPPQAASPPRGGTILRFDPKTGERLF